MAQKAVSEFDTSKNTFNKDSVSNNMKCSQKGNKGFSGMSEAERLRGKRPELQRYKPGMGLSTRNSPKLNQSAGDEDYVSNPDGEECSKFISNKSQSKPARSVCESEASDIALEDSMESSKPLKSRRPDKAVYIPRPKQAFNFSSSSSSLVDFEVTPNHLSSSNLSDSEWEGSHLSSASERNTSQPSKSRMPSKTVHDSQNINGVTEVKHNVSPNCSTPKNSVRDAVFSRSAFKSDPYLSSDNNPDNTHNLKQLEQFNKRNANEDKTQKGKSDNLMNNDVNNKEKSTKRKNKRSRKKSESKVFDGNANVSSNASSRVNIYHSNTQPRERANVSREIGVSNHPEALVNGVLHEKSPVESKQDKILNNRNFRKGSSSPSKDTDQNLNHSEDLVRNVTSPDYTQRVPALSLEPSSPVGDWFAQVEREEEEQEMAHSLNRNKHKNKKSDRPAVKSYKDKRVQKPLPVSNGNRDKPQHHEPLPPRFQKQNRESVQQFQPPETCDNLQNEMKIGGILHLPAETILTNNDVQKQSAPTTSFFSRERFNRPSPEQVPYIPAKQLYDPKNVDISTECHLGYRPRLPLQTENTQMYIPPVLPQQLPFVDQFPHRSCLPRPPCMYPSYGLNVTYSGLHAVQNPLATMPTFPAASFSDQLHIDQQGKRRVKPLVEKNVGDAGLLERELNTYLSRGLDQVDIKALSNCRWKLQLRYENIILADPRFCAERNVENALWKSAFHQVIEAYRRLKEEHPHKEDEVNKAIINLVEEGTVFYESLLEKQQETFGLNLLQFLEPDTVRTQYPDSVKFILFSAQKIFICLGDLARYREQATSTSNYGKARSWYMKAQQIAPKNGRPYNQLAILALCARRKLDAVYFYMRSLAASNPFLSAKESLLSLFDETRKKYEMVEKKRLEDKMSARNEKKLQKEIVTEDRVEIWSHPKMFSNQHSSGSKEESVKEMSTVDLNKRFVLSFLHVHGKLFTKVGMEDFTEIANQMLLEFRCLLQRTPAPYTSVRLLQLLTINLFAIANTTLRDKSLGTECCSLLQEQALQVSLGMMAIILERSTYLIQEQLNTPPSDGQSISDDLAQLLPTIKIWTDWMACQRALWHPPPNYGDLKTGCSGDVWKLYAEFLNVLKEVNVDHIPTLSEKRDGFELVTLPEDNSLAGFVPLLGVPEKSTYALAPFDKEKARFLLRINCMKYFGDYLCGIQPPYLEFDVQKNCYFSLVQPQSPESTESSPQSSEHNTSDEDSWPEDGGEDGEEEFGKSLSDEDSEIRKLWSRKESLKRAKRRQEKHQAHIQELLRGDHTRLVVQVCPRIVVPDTNCFINHLDRMKLLMDAGIFQVCVPLIVINELDGLTRGSRDSEEVDISHLSLSSPSSGRFRGSPSSSWRNLGTSTPTPQNQQQQVLHSNHAMQGSRLAVSFLEQRFADGDPKLRAVTAKGSLLDTISFRSEDVSDSKGTNDDLILTCCLHFCPDRASNYMPREPGMPLRLHREVVLLTEDRNLVVKAMSHNVPVKSVIQFLSWANIR